MSETLLSEVLLSKAPRPAANAAANVGENVGASLRISRRLLGHLNTWRALALALIVVSSPARSAEPDLNPALSAIPAGCVVITRPGGASGQTCVGPYRLTTHEVTVAAFRAFVKATNYQTDAELSTGGVQGCASEERGGWEYRADRNWRNPGFAQSARHPVVCVSWQDALIYADWLSTKTEQRYRLPTEAEWIRAARGRVGQRSLESVTSSGRCQIGNVRDRAARLIWFPVDHHDCDDREGYTARVGAYQAGPFGLRDLLGNVWEWTCSSFSDTGITASARCDFDNPKAAKVLRGASWFDPPENAHINVRIPVAPYQRNAATGFRLVAEGQP